MSGFQAFWISFSPRRGKALFEGPFQSRHPSSRPLWDQTLLSFLFIYHTFIPTEENTRWLTLKHELAPRWMSFPDSQKKPEHPGKESGEKVVMKGKKFVELRISNCDCFVVLLKTVGYQGLGATEKGESKLSPRWEREPEVLELMAPFSPRATAK